MTFPFVPLGSQFTHPTLEDDPGMNAAVDARLNALRAHALGGFQQSLPRFRAVQRTAGQTVTTAGTVITWDNVIEDTHSGYNKPGAVTGSYTIPVTGTYLIQGQFKQVGALVLTFGLKGVTGQGEWLAGSGDVEGGFSDALTGSAGEMPLIAARLTAGTVLTGTAQVVSGTTTIYSTDPAADGTWWHVFGITA